ncbi:cohesin-associated protein Pds5 [Dentipellis sp. KUC8613]|nr:cohesin-associated protein Pds5 [Dentipellis sp. KUC8613]
MVAQTRTGGSHRLRFSDKLVGKGLSTDALLKKLKTLHVELADLDQDTVDVASLGAVRKELVHTSILLHKDRGVKAYAACCLADLLRLYAPDAPYTQNELRDIFQFFFRQLTTGLKGPDAPYYQEYFHLLESLSTVKSVVLVCDLPHADELIMDIFRDFFALVRQDLAKKIEMFLADILVALIDEAQSLPNEVLETLMAQFMDKHPGMDNPAFRLAVQVCNATADKLQRHVCQYFTDIIVAHAPSDEDETDLADIRTAHDLIKRLHRTCPGLLHNVVPQLEEELRVEDVSLRTLATQALGEMFADKGGPDLVRKYPTTWNVWLMRKNDKSPTVRLALVEATRGLITSLADQREIIEEALSSKLLDPDEKVRAAVCKLYSQLDYEAALHHVSVQQLRNVAGRGLDKKHSVRVEALNSVGKLYSLAYPEIENGDPAAVRQFSWIPQAILHMSSTTQEVRAAVEHVFLEYVLPMPSARNAEVDEAAWTDRLLTTMRFLDEKAVNALLILSGIKTPRPSGYERFVDCCVDYNGGIMDENEDQITRRLNIIVQRISGSMPDPQKAAEDLRAFAKLNEGRLYKLLKTCMDTQTDLKTLVKSSSEFLKRIDQSAVTLHATMSTFLRRASLRFINQSSVPQLVRRLQRDTGTEGDSAAMLLSFVAKHCPALFRSHVGELAKACSADARSGHARQVEVCLQALAAVAAVDEKLAPSDKRMTERVLRFALDSDARHSKFAARLLARSKDSAKQCAHAIADTLPEMDLDSEDETLVAHLAVLREFASAAPDAFEKRSQDIMSFVVKNVLMQPVTLDPNMMLVDTEWIENADMPVALRAQLVALKVCRVRCLAHATAPTALDVAIPVMKMFMSILENGGSLSAASAETDDDFHYSPRVKSRLRLQAAVSLLHLASADAFGRFVNEHFIMLAITIQDACYQVRFGFLSKLVMLLSNQKLPAHFNTIPFITIHDPEADVKSMAKAYVIYAYRSAPPAMRLARFEMIFVRFLHLLAHHPDFALTQDSLPDMAKYIEFYLELIANSENISLLYHLAGKMKTVRDSESQMCSEHLYALSELAQYVIKARAQTHNWSLQSYPGKIKLFSDILKPLPNAQTANEILKHVYLPEETLEWLKEHTKAARAAAAAEKPKPPRKRKASAATRTNGQTK